MSLPIGESAVAGFSSDSPFIPAASGTSLEGTVADAIFLHSEVQLLGRLESARAHLLYTRVLYVTPYLGGGIPKTGAGLKVQCGDSDKIVATHTNSTRMNREVGVELLEQSRG